jgi:hypothetical protein
LRKVVSYTLSTSSDPKTWLWGPRTWAGTHLEFGNTAVSALTQDVSKAATSLCNYPEALKMDSSETSIFELLCY